MAITLPSAALGQMSEQERNRVLEEVQSAAGEALDAFRAVVDARLRVFEHRYELSSSALPGAMKAGRLPDTADVSQWLFWLDVRTHLAGKTRA